MFSDYYRSILKPVSPDLEQKNEKSILTINPEVPSFGGSKMFSPMSEVSGKEKKVFLKIKSTNNP